MNDGMLVSVHCYEGDKGQVVDLMPGFEHHGRPILIVSPEDSKVTGIGPHTCIFAGKRAYTGQDSLDRQYLQMKKLLEYPFDYYLMNDADSFVLPPQLPASLFKGDVVYSNEVADFRIPGQRWGDNTEPWPDDYHAGHPLVAMQPPYFMSRACLQKIIDKCKDIQACPITPFIDWYMVQCVVKAEVEHKPFQDEYGKRLGASCETVTDQGIKAMKEEIARGAIFIHSIKTKRVFDDLNLLYKQLNP